MADSTDRTNDVAIWNEARTDNATVTNSRLDTNIKASETIPVSITGGSSRPLKAKLFEFVGNQTNVTILTPASGKKIDVYFCALTSDDSSGAKVVVEFLTSVQKVFIDWTKTGSSPAQLVNFQGATNEVLTLNVTGLPGSKNGVIYIGYGEID